MTRLRIGLLTASASRLGGGVFEAVVQQAQMIEAVGHTPVIIALGDKFSMADRPRFKGAEVVTCTVLGPASIGYAPQLVGHLHRLRLDVLHLHGIWMYPSRAGAVWARQSRRPYIISPHGMLAPWITARGRWKKALARTYYERSGWRQADLLHALTTAEAQDIMRECGRTDTAVIPNAGPPPGAPRDTLPAPIISFVGRIHPKKNLNSLIRAWAMLQAADALPPAAQLVIAGWGNQAQVAALQQRIGDVANVRFIGPVTGAAKQSLMERSRFAILPSLSEGLPMAVLEAWAAPVPVLMSKHCQLPEGFNQGGAIDCGTTANDIAAALRTAFAMDDRKWHAMAQAAQRLASTRFDRSRIAQLWNHTYEGLVSPKGRADAGKEIAGSSIADRRSS
ncbi:glycosyltransferase [Croceicoccus sp. F390]|uniref:Glycosyltransferase n=1 Tax=Croceicoccus esteveae TaxID=3075597 RepID=A0ABU2ZH94_9SPHN|nr:glycosyltransferase [Croceicoccus sp. F390]MDT0575731.1 glycosyltransferase [Croceicoccus sp. F390]